MVIKLPIGVRDRHLLLARFSKNQVYIHFTGIADAKLAIEDDLR